jgi:hypothetical protein
MDTFKRYEKKYILTVEQKEQLEERIKDYMDLDPFCKAHNNYLIRNIYYDTENNDLIHMSVNKPVFKEKVRVRKYGKYGDGRDEYFLEVKRKSEKIVYKRRITLTRKELDAFLNDGIVPEKKKYMDQQVGKELKYLLDTYTLKPAAFISYVRVAYFDKTDSSFRLTFDNQIHSRRHDMDFDNPEYEKLLLPEGYFLMEVKVSTAFPLWFARALSDLKIYPGSFSKYGQDYKLYVMEGSKL